MSAHALACALRAFAVDAQDISHGIFDSALSLADCLDAGEITSAEASEQLAELRSDLAEAEAAP